MPVCAVRSLLRLFSRRLIRTLKRKQVEDKGVVQKTVHISQFYFEFESKVEFNLTFSFLLMNSASPNLPPYGLDYFPVIPGRDYGHSDYDDYSPAEGSRSGFRGSLPDETYRRPEYR